MMVAFETQHSSWSPSLFIAQVVTQTAYTPTRPVMRSEAKKLSEASTQRGSPFGVGKLELLHAKHEILIVGQAFDRKVDEAAYPGGLSGAAAVIEKQAVHIGHVFK